MFPSGGQPTNDSIRADMSDSIRRRPGEASVPVHVAPEYPDDPVRKRRRRNQCPVYIVVLALVLGCCIGALIVNGIDRGGQQAVSSNDAIPRESAVSDVNRSTAVVSKPANTAPSSTPRANPFVADRMMRRGRMADGAGQMDASTSTGTASPAGPVKCLSDFWRQDCVVDPNACTTNVRSLQRHMQSPFRVVLAATPLPLRTPSFLVVRLRQTFARPPALAGGRTASTTC